VSGVLSVESLGIKFRSLIKARIIKMSNPHDAEILSHIFNPLLPTKGLVGEDDIIPEELLN